MAVSVLVAGARTPVGRLLGGLKDLSATDLGGVAIRGALDKGGVDPDQVDYVIMGQVLQAGAGQIPARQAAVNAGISMTVPAITIRSASRGVPRITSAPKRAISNLLVKLVAIST